MSAFINPQNLSNAAQLYTFVKPFIDPIIKNIYSDKIEKYFDKKEKSKNIAKYKDRLENYLVTTYEKYITINTLVFPNTQVSIEDIFYPVNIVNISEISSFNNQEVISWDNIENIFSINNKALIADNAGMGKSTLVKMFAINQIKKSSGIPILIELKKLTQEHKIINEILNQLNSEENEFDESDIWFLLKTGQFFILLDGFDEIKSEHKEIITQELSSFIPKINSNKFIITSRPEETLTSFGSFKKYKICPLEINDSFALIKKLDNISKCHLADKLIEDIKANEQVHEFLSNPFLVSLLYKCYLYSRDLPLKRISFYSDVYLALYKSHDLSKDGYKREIKSKLDIESFRDVLNQLAYISFKNNIVEYSYEELISHLKECQKSLTHLNFKAHTFIYDVISTVPLFVKDGNVYRWAHKSFQDYFAANSISQSMNAERILGNIYKKKIARALNLLVFLGEINHSLIERTIVKWILEEFNNYIENSYLVVTNTMTNKAIINILFNINFRVAFITNQEVEKLLEKRKLLKAESSKNEYRSESDIAFQIVDEKHSSAFTGMEYGYTCKGRDFFAVLFVGSKDKFINDIISSLEASFDTARMIIDRSSSPSLDMTYEELINTYKVDDIELYSADYFSNDEKINLANKFGLDSRIFIPYLEQDKALEFLAKIDEKLSKQTDDLDFD